MARVFFASRSKKQPEIDSAEVLAFITVFVGLGAIAVALSGVKSMEQFAPLHFNLCFVFASTASCFVIFSLFSRHAKYEERMNRVTKGKAAIGLFLGLLVQFFIQKFVQFAFPVALDSGTTSKQNLRAFLVGDFHSTIGFGCLIIWVAVVTLSAMVASLRRLFPIQR